MKNFADLTEREVLAVAISGEEEDSRIYMSFAEDLKERYPDSAKVFEEMAEVGRECGDVETVFRSFQDKGIAAGMAGRDAESAGFALAQLEYATELGEAAKISAAVAYCTDQKLSSYVAPESPEFRRLVENIRTKSSPPLKVEAGIALAAAPFLPITERRALLEEVHALALQVGPTKLAADALSALTKLRSAT